MLGRSPSVSAQAAPHPARDVELYRQLIKMPFCLPGTAGGSDGPSWWAAPLSARHMHWSDQPSVVCERRPQVPHRRRHTRTHAQTNGFSQSPAFPGRVPPFHPSVTAPRPTPSPPSTRIALAYLYMPTRARQGCMRPDQHVADGSVPVLARGSGHDTPVTGKCRLPAHSRAPGPALPLAQGPWLRDGMATSAQSTLLYGPGRGGRGGWARSRIEADFVSRVLG